MAHRGTHVSIIGSYLSPYVRKVLAACHMKQLTYDIDPIIPFFGNDEFRKISPLNRIPVLFHGEDLTLTDSSVICEYLEEAFPDRGSALFPRPASADGCSGASDPAIRAKARMVEELGDTRFADVLIWQLWYELSIAKNVFGKVPDQQVIDQTLQKDIPKLLTFITQELIEKLPGNRQLVKSGTSGFLFGESPLIADIALCVSFRQMELLKMDIGKLYGDQFPTAVKYIERVLRHETMSFTEPFQAASLRGKAEERRHNCQLAGAPISLKYNFGTLTVPRQFTD